MQRGDEDSASGEDILTIEREVLRAMCQFVCGGNGPLHREQVQRLNQYRFQDPTHQVIFDTLVELYESFPRGSASGLQSLGEHLARLLTRKGFPDVDLEALFQPCHLNQEEMARRVHRLVANDKQAVNENPA